MDLPPILSALGAYVVVSGPKGDRMVLVEDLYAGYYDTVLARNELIAKVIIPPQGTYLAAYSKVTTRSHHDWPALGLAAVLGQDSDGRLGSVSLVMGAATDRPTRLVSAEKMLQGSLAEDHLLREAGALAAAELDIVGDAHGSADYKKQLLRTYLGRTVKQALGTAHQGVTK
jgi:carbon-monoxide dehydrogenase medium subunit